jgi:hypothetical protein
MHKYTERAAAFNAGSSFVLEKPLTFDSIRRPLHAAQALILRERRRSFRRPIAIPVSIQREGMLPVCGETVNISEGGMALRILPPLCGGWRRPYYSLCHAPTCQSELRPGFAGTTSCARRGGRSFRSRHVIALNCKSGSLAGLRSN